jgi:hypothetical protein
MTPIFKGPVCARTVSKRAIPALAARPAPPAITARREIPVRDAIRSSF